MTAVRTEVVEGVARITLCRPDEYNTITPALRDELDDALDRAERDRAVRVVLLDAEGPAFCAGYGLDWATAAQDREASGADDGEQSRIWDSADDHQMINRFTRVWARLHELSAPTIAAVQGWCIAGGTNMVFNADLIVCGESSRFGYPPSRVWGIPEAPWTWIARMGLERTKRFMLTGDEITGPDAAAMGLVLECVPDEELADRAWELAARMALVPRNQLQMIKWACNDVARTMYDPAGSRRIGTLFDGVARHSQEGMDFVARSQEVGFREAVRERDRPFGDYGERGR